VPGEGLGQALVVDALRRVAVAAEVIGVRAMLIHRKNETARDFYLRLAKFDPSPTDPMHLFLLIKDLRQAISGGLPAGSPGRETGTRARGRGVPAGGAERIRSHLGSGRRAARRYPAAAAPWLVGIRGHSRRGHVPRQGVTVPQSGQ
jgi:hypothetical protein